MAVRAGQDEEARLALELDACAAPDPEAFAALEEAQRRRARRRRRAAAVVRRVAGPREERTGRACLSARES